MQRTFIRFAGGPLATAVKQEVKLLGGEYANGIAFSISGNSGLSKTDFDALVTASDTAVGKDTYGIPLCQSCAFGRRDQEENKVISAWGFGVSETDEKKLLRGLVGFRGDDVVVIDLYGAPSGVPSVTVHAQLDNQGAFKDIIIDSSTAGRVSDTSDADNIKKMFPVTTLVNDVAKITP